jgi:molybdopterin/thiamine biosynthesis adenylyltransferase/rhodanese-related sulfurtransferase
MTFTLEEKQRYSRHFSLPQVGMEGQARLKNSKILCIGAGGLASPALLYLSAAGVGTLGIVDHDRVELSNLQRQVLYETHDIGQAKALAAKSQLLKKNPHTHITAFPEKFTKHNALNIVKNYDIVLDGTDNFNARYLINDACRTLDKPHIYASIFQFSGECSVFMPGSQPCYRCLYDIYPLDLNELGRRRPQETGQFSGVQARMASESENASRTSKAMGMPSSATPNCSEAGVLGVLPGIMGSIQAAEALKLALGQPPSLAGKVLRFNALTLAFEPFTLTLSPDCPMHAQDRSFQNFSQEHCAMTQQIERVTPQELKTMREQNGDFILLDVREPYEYEACNLRGVLIPLGELSLRYEELDKEKHIIVHCRSDGRSIRAAEFLCNAGFQSVKYLQGGISAWASEIDPTMSVG